MALRMFCGTCECDVTDLEAELCEELGHDVVAVLPDPSCTFCNFPRNVHSEEPPYDYENDDIYCPGFDYAEGN